MSMTDDGNAPVKRPEARDPNEPATSGVKAAAYS